MFPPENPIRMTVGVLTLSVVRNTDGRKIIKLSEFQDEAKN